MSVDNEKYLLETSTIHAQFSNYRKLNSHKLYKRLQSQKNYALYFSIYEFKVGFIKTALDYYYLIKLKGNPADALEEWSHTYKIRELKNITTIEVLLKRINKKLSSDPKDTSEYLDRLEAIITDILDRFDVYISHFVGEFANNPVVKFEICDKNDFEKFTKVCSENKTIDLIGFFKKHEKNIETILENKSKLPDKLIKHLDKIEEDISKVNNYYTNKKMGDVVIALDTPKTTTIVTLDKIFENLCDIFDKKHELIKLR